MERSTVQSCLAAPAFSLQMLTFLSSLPTWCDTELACAHRTKHETACKCVQNPCSRSHDVLSGSVRPRPGRDHTRLGSSRTIRRAPSQTSTGSDSTSCRACAMASASSVAVRTVCVFTVPSRVAADYHDQKGGDVGLPAPIRVASTSGTPKTNFRIYPATTPGNFLGRITVPLRRRD
jgi:hypothetical protein